MHQKVQSSRLKNPPCPKNVHTGQNPSPLTVDVFYGRPLITARVADAPSSAPLLPFLTSGPDLGMWPDCWVSVEFLHTPSLGRGRVAPPQQNKAV